MAAVDPLKQRAQSDGKDASALAAIAAAALDADDNLTARATLLGIKPTELDANPVLLDALGTCLMSLAQFEEAVRIYQKYINRYPTDLNGHLGLSNAYLSLGRRSESAAALESASAALSPTDIGSRLKLSVIFDERIDTPRALLEANKALGAVPSNAGVLVSVARLQYKLHRVKEARDLAARALVLEPGNAVSHRLLGDLAADVLIPGADPAAAENHYLRSLQYAPGDAKVLESLATLLLSQKRYRQAAFVTLNWLNSEPNSGSARVLLAKAYQGMGDVSASKQQEELGQELLATQRRIGQLSKFRNQKPRDARIRVQLAKALRESQHWADALVEAQAAYCLDPNNPHTRDELSTIYRSVGLHSPSPGLVKSPPDLSDALR